MSHAFVAIPAFVAGFLFAAHVSGLVIDDYVKAGGFQRDGSLYRIEKISREGVE